MLATSRSLECEMTDLAAQASERLRQRPRITGERSPSGKPGPRRRAGLREHRRRRAPPRVLAIRRGCNAWSALAARQRRRRVASPPRRGGARRDGCERVAHRLTRSMGGAAVLARAPLNDLDRHIEFTPATVGSIAFRGPTDFECHLFQFTGESKRRCIAP